MWEPLKAQIFFRHSFLMCLRHNYLPTAYPIWNVRHFKPTFNSVHVLPPLISVIWRANITSMTFEKSAISTLKGNEFFSLCLRLLNWVTSNPPFWTEVYSLSYKLSKRLNKWLPPSEPQLTLMDRYEGGRELYSDRNLQTIITSSWETFATLARVRLQLMIFNERNIFPLLLLYRQASCSHKSQYLTIEWTRRQTKELKQHIR